MPSSTTSRTSTAPGRALRCRRHCRSECRRRTSCSPTRTGPRQTRGTLSRTLTQIPPTLARCFSSTSRRPSPPTTDLHALRPADWNVNSARGNLPFSWCNVSTECRDIPAHSEADATTGKDAQVFMPPIKVRGDVARALMYMAVRYDGSDKDTNALRLGECPCPTSSTMGVLSVLLHWHALDPPSPHEIARNDKVCRKYQGNRNPFVDKPELAAGVFGGGGGSCVWDTGPACAPAAAGVGQDDDAVLEAAKESSVAPVAGAGVVGLVMGLVLCSVCCLLAALWHSYHSCYSNSKRRQLSPQKEKAASAAREEDMREERAERREEEVHESRQGTRVQKMCVPAEPAGGEYTISSV